eukprot:TRINITY_DN33395_c0_g1_i1.p1 TRINITY_DN33395_c0_g1~~TRINITY_DN33395_c0_g1_i1.p1  ORF type:complete len:330 (-),score=14.95 TRINITY_DN33395_c0_g1_i1:390-1379(-)
MDILNTPPRSLAYQIFRAESKTHPKPIRIMLQRLCILQPKITRRSIATPLTSSSLSSYFPICSCSSISEAITGSANETPYQFPSLSTLLAGRDPWLEERKWILTPSIIRNAIGFRIGDPAILWAEKIGLTEPFPGNSGTTWNNKHRIEALKRYRDLTGNKVSLSGFKLHSKYDWLGASPRALLTDEEGKGMVEVKCPFSRGNPNEAEPWDSFPAYYIPRLQCAMEILGKEWLDFYVWFPKGSSLFRIYRDPECCDLVMDALVDFWMNHVVPAKEILHQCSDSRSRLLRFRPLPRNPRYKDILEKSFALLRDSKLLVKDFHGAEQAKEDS